MEDGASVNSQPQQVNEMKELEFARWRSSIMDFHKGTFFLITILGLCLQLMFTAASPFAPKINRNTVLMRLFIIDIVTYCASFGVMILKTNHTNIKFGDFMNKICVVLGTLACVLELLVLFPPFGWVTLVLWSIGFVTIEVKSYSYSKKLCATLVEELDSLYKKVKDLMIKRKRDSTEQDGSAEDASKKMPV